jgi:hypothetical protein
VPTTGGGTVDLNANGSFTYLPGRGDKNLTDDTFTYHVTDGIATSSGTGTIDVDNQLVWYVNGAAPDTTGDGTSTKPFKTLNGNGTNGINGPAATDADGTGDYIFLYGGNSYSGGLPLEASQQLVGQPAGLSVPGHAGIVAAASTNPVLTGANNVDSLQLANTVDVSRVDATGSTGTSAAVRGTGVTAATYGSSTTITGGSGGGLVLSGAATGTITVGSAISNSAGAAASIQNRSGGTTTLNGAITDSSSSPIVVSNNTGGTVDLNGTISQSGTGGLQIGSAGNGNSATTVTVDGTVTESSSSGGGVAIGANSASTAVTFSNSITTANGGISASSNSGSTLTFNGQLSLTGTGSTAGFTATGAASPATSGGTVKVSGTNNIVSTAAGRGVDIRHTTIGTGGVNFKKVSTSGADSGILLNDTGTTAGLTVSGGSSVVQGGDNAGGTIANAAGDGISLTGTKSPSFNNVTITSPAHSGVKGFDSGATDGVHGFSFTNGKITGAGQSAASDPKDSAFAFNQQTAGPSDDNNVDGGLTISNNIVTSPYGGGVYIQQYTGTISNASITNNALTSDDSLATSKAHGIIINLNGADSGGGVANLTKATIDGNDVHGFPNGHGIAMIGGNTAPSTASMTMGVPSGIPGTGSGGNIVNVTNNKSRGYAGTTRQTGNSINIDFEGRGQASFNVANNGSAAVPITNSKLVPIGIGAGGDVHVDIKVDGNYVTSATDNNGASGIGITTGERIVANPVTPGGPGVPLDGAVVNSIFNSNIVTASSGAGLDFRMLSQNTTGQTKVTNNNLANPLQFGSGLQMRVGSNTSNPSEVPSLCAAISGNTTGTGPPSAGFVAPGISLYAFQPSAVFKLAGGFPGPDNAAAESFVGSNNPGSTTGVGAGFTGRAAVRTGTISQSCTLGF